MDVDALEPGVDFVKAIEKSVSFCDVLIAVIGKHWLTSSDEEGQHRLDNPEDYVRIEIATALKRDVRVIPVLVDGASIPKPRDLPDDLKSFVRRTAIEVRHTRFKDDCERLIVAIERAFEAAKAQQLSASDGIRRVAETAVIKTERRAEVSAVSSAAAAPARMMQATTW